MKKCPTPNFLCWSKLLGVILHLLVTILNISFWNIAYYNSFQSVDKMVNARCIHDEMKFAIKDQSPQEYDRLPSTSDSKTLFHKSVSTEKVFQKIITGQHSGSSQTFSEAQTLSNHGFIEDFEFIFHYFKLVLRSFVNVKTDCTVTLDFY